MKHIQHKHFDSGKWVFAWNVSLWLYTTKMLIYSMWNMMMWFMDGKIIIGHYKRNLISQLLCSTFVSKLERKIIRKHTPIRGILELQCDADHQRMNNGKITTVFEAWEKSIREPSTNLWNPSASPNATSLPFIHWTHMEILLRQTANEPKHQPYRHV